MSKVRALLFTALLCASPTVAAQDDFSVDLEGYYRTRGYSFPGLFAEQDAPAKFAAHRLRLRPVLNFEDRAIFTFEVNALDDVVWGDNASLSSTSLFAGSPSNTGMDGIEQGSMTLDRAWMEFSIPVGKFRVGRQPSHWGMGLLANHGNGFDDTFGENHGGSTYDRVMFLTQPLAVLNAITGLGSATAPLFFAVGMDRLVEDPLIQYYGFDCSGVGSGVLSGDSLYDPACDKDGDGVTDSNHDYTDDTRLDSDRSQQWWVDSEDDVMEMVYALIYRGDNVALFGTIGELTAGTYVVRRKQAETNSDVTILDAYIKAQFHGIAAEFEGLTITGPTNAIALPGAFDPYGELENPLHKEANISAYVGRLGYIRPGWTAMFETGYASGDENVSDTDFTGRPIHPDFNVGLLLYEEILARVTAETWTEDAAGLWSNGGVYNSRYVFPNITIRPMDNWELIGAFLMAWPDKPDGARIRCAEGDDVECAEYRATADHLGWEADVALKHKWNNHIMFSAEAAWAQVTDRIPLEAADLNESGSFYTFQTRIAYAF